jgi:hypothetical protein
MENTNVGGGKDQMSKDPRKEQDATKKAGQSQGGSSQQWQPHDKSHDKPGSQRPGSANENESTREGGQKPFGGQSNQSGQRDQTNRPGQPGNQSR